MYRKKLNAEDVVLDTIIYSFLILVALATLYPFVNIIAISFNDALDTIRGGVYIWPRKWTLRNYNIILSNPEIYHAAVISVLRTVLGTVLGIICSLLVAYPLSRKDFVLRKGASAILVFTMYFSGGLIPTYLLMRYLHLLNTFWVYIIPSLLGMFNVIVLRSYIETLPGSIVESAKIDGASEFRILFTIIFPLTLPAIATIALFIGVWHWNSWFDVYLYNPQRPELSTLQFELQKILASVSMQTSRNPNFEAGSMTQQMQTVTPESVRAAMTIVAVAPILLVYPFLQRYFVKGLTIGSVKGA